MEQQVYSILNGSNPLATQQSIQLGAIRGQTTNLTLGDLVKGYIKLDYLNQQFVANDGKKNVVIMNKNGLFIYDDSQPQNLLVSIDSTGAHFHGIPNVSTSSAVDFQTPGVGDLGAGKDVVGQILLSSGKMQVSSVLGIGLQIHGGAGLNLNAQGGDVTVTLPGASPGGARNFIINDGTNPVFAVDYTGVIYTNQIENPVGTGAIIKRIPIFDQNQVFQGYLPLYNVL